MSLNELIEALTALRDKIGADMPVRLVKRRGELGDQYPCMDVQCTEGLHGPIILLFGGAEAAEMSWPREPLA
jgi:hypothetical protein